MNLKAFYAEFNECFKGNLMYFCVFNQTTYTYVYIKKLQIIELNSNCLDFKFK